MHLEITWLSTDPCRSNSGFVAIILPTKFTAATLEGYRRTRVTLGRSRRRQKDFQDIESTGEVPVYGVLSDVFDHWNSISSNRSAKFVAVYLELKRIGTVAKKARG